MSALLSALLPLRRNPTVRFFLSPGTAPSSASALAVADALLDELRRIVGPLDPQVLRRHPQVSLPDLVRFPLFAAVLEYGRVFIPSFFSFFSLA
jgi:hypothetical protein